MVLCPIALAVGCTKCPAFKVCPVKSVIGDYKPEPAATAKAAPVRAASKPAAARKPTSGRNRRGGKRSR